MTPKNKATSWSLAVLVGLFVLFIFLFAAMLDCSAGVAPC